MTEINRTEAQAELRQVIADAFAAHTLWTTDWAGVQLQRCSRVETLISTSAPYGSFHCFLSLLPKPTPTFGNNLKRKTLMLFSVIAPSLTLANLLTGPTAQR